MKSGKKSNRRGVIIELDEPLILISIADVTQIKLSERSRSEALNFLSHDLRAPMASILALIETARGDRSHQQSRELLTEIEQHIHRNLEYAENFIRLSRIAHETTPELEYVDAQFLIDNAVAQLFHGAARRQIQIVTDVPDEEAWLHCNASMMERALQNLLDNAVKYSGDGTRVELALRLDDGHLVFSVTDSGPGIRPSDQQRIFEMFHQGKNAIAGVGLGLRFVAAAAEVHGGEVGVENAPGGGARFWMRVPAA